MSVDTHPKHDVAMGAALWQQPSKVVADAGPERGSVRPVTSRVEPAESSNAEVRTAIDAGAQRTVSPRSEEPRRRPRVVSAGVRGLLHRIRSPRWLLVALISLAAVGGAIVTARSLSVEGPDRPPQSTAGGSASTPGSSSTSPGDQAVPRSATPLGAESLVWPRMRENVWGIGIASLTGQQSVLATDASANSSFPVISPDRRSVIYLGGNGWTARIVGTDGGGDRQLFAPPPDCPRIQAPAWGPDGLLVLPCQKAPGTPSFLQVVTLDGEVRRTLDSGVLGDPTFTRDGRSVIYWRNSVGSLDGGSLYRISIQGGARHRLTAGGDGDDNDPVCSPDGKTVAYRTVSNGRFVVAKISLDPSASSKALATPVVLTKGASIEQEPSWSPDGRQIAFIRGTGNDRDLYVMNSDGSAPRALVKDDEPDAAPAWTSR